MAKCGKLTEIYSRVTGYFRPLNNWNKGKKEEFSNRETYQIGEKNGSGPLLVTLNCSSCRWAGYAKYQPSGRCPICGGELVEYQSRAWLSVSRDQRFLSVYEV